MKTVALWCLIAMNAVLLGSFASRMIKSNTANAQASGRPGDYLMIPGSVIGGVNDVVYVLDQNNHTLGAVSYDDPTHSLIAMKPPRDLDRDFDATARNR